MLISEEDRLTQEIEAEDRVLMVELVKGIQIEVAKEVEVEEEAK